MITIRRKLMAKMQSGGLPDAYRKVEYLESNGNQYCLTDVPFRYELDAEGVFMPTNSMDGVLFGSHRVNNSQSVGNFGYYSGNVQYFYNAYHYFDVGTSGNRYKQSIGTKYHAFSSMRLGRQTLTINGQECLENNFTMPELSQIDGYFAIFAMFSPPSTYSYKYIGRIYSLKLSSVDGILLGDFVPCVRKADSKPGIYNLVTGGFFTNQGTGEFIYA